MSTAKQRNSLFLVPNLHGASFARVPPQWPLLRAGAVSARQRRGRAAIGCGESFGATSEADGVGQASKQQWHGHGVPKSETFEAMYGCMCFQVFCALITEYNRLWEHQSNEYGHATNVACLSMSRMHSSSSKAWPRGEMFLFLMFQSSVLHN